MSSDSFWDMLTNHTKVAGGPSAGEHLKVADAQVSWTREEVNVFHSCIFITTCARKLEVNSIIRCTACWLFHKFNSVVNMQDYDEYVVAMASIFLAGKIEETPIKIRDVVNVAYSTLYPDKPLLQIDGTYTQLADSLVQFELLLCRVVKFNLTHNSPHKYLLHYLKSLSDWIGADADLTLFNKTAWSLLNDCFLSKLCITSKPHHLALTVCYVAMEAHKVKVPLQEHAENAWWQVFVDDIKLSDITVLASKVLELYENERAIK